MFFKEPGFTFSSGPLPLYFLTSPLTSLNSRRVAKGVARLPLCVYVHMYSKLSFGRKRESSENVWFHSYFF